LGPQYVEELDTDFTEQEVKGYVIGMKNNKAVGFDGIPTEMWNIFSIKNDGIKILTNMFNKVKNKNEFPSDWKVAIICPIYKGKGRPQEPGNFVIISFGKNIFRDFSRQTEGLVVKPRSVVGVSSTTGERKKDT
jgi:hypothetical protein